MSSCERQPLSGYLDDELSAADRVEVERHLRDCAACSERLEQLREASALLQTYPFEDVTDAEVERLHAAIDANAAEDRLLWRFGATSAVIAASLLIIGFAWLNALTGTSGRTRETAAAPAASFPVWERVAMTLHAAPLPDNGDALQLADARFAEWMVEGLALGAEQ